MVNRWLLDLIARCVQYRRDAQRRCSKQCMSWSKLRERFFQRSYAVMQLLPGQLGLQHKVPAPRYWQGPFCLNQLLHLNEQ